MVVLSAIGKFFKFIIKSVVKFVLWILKGFLTPMGLLIRLLVIGAIALTFVFVF